MNRSVRLECRADSPTKHSWALRTIEPSSSQSQRASTGLLIETGYAHQRKDVAVDNGVALFDVEPTDGPASGVVTLTALSGDRTGHSTIELIPGTAVDPPDLFLGPRTIEATNDTATMIVVIAEDEFGNPVVDGTEVAVRVTRPDL